MISGRLPSGWLTVYRSPLISTQFLFHALQLSGQMAFSISLLRCYQRERPDDTNIRDVAGDSDSIIVEVAGGSHSDIRGGGGASGGTLLQLVPSLAP